jgi:hypothetical protein
MGHECLWLHIANWFFLDASMVEEVFNDMEEVEVVRYVAPARVVAREPAEV